ncbi:hypothetical protein HLB23_36855 [Nocardia uniformis]|uniref:Mce-associated membrane protein n=1 Tax=Nocardia uniformis TaxID=53432 RepID=A0A849CHD8_9NOCA|nr:hypothetical protein [Nocardia uniformis]NNH75359.1 hypothetical protein [Nocardia uniformis]
MANKRPAVNRVTPKRRPAAQRSSGARTTAADVRGQADRGTSDTARSSSTARPRVGLSKERPAASRPQRQPAARGAWWKTWRTAIICGIAAAVLGAFAVVAAFRPGVDDSNLAYVDNKSTTEVKAAASNALSTLYGYRAAEIDTWKDAVGAVLTDDMRADLEKYIDTTVDTIKQAQTDTEVTTDPIGVTLLTDDRAELLVDLNVVAVKDGSPQPLASGPVVLRMQKVDGRWLAAEIADN